ncbi:helix-turn-helix domain-containing protein [Lentzea kentuckyensis]|uniref:helix-turn-helix domain-containing protein n=1 Tax=Lentzea kentuckyensis TaxID=360086 RepID=UPI000A3CA812|nr:helix-turn-helix domain-containing protein [Lentzea kentuckyensis]
MEHVNETTAASAEVPRTLAEKVDHLFREVRPRGRKPFTHPEVSAATGLSTGLLSALRSGKNTNPTKDTLERLAEFFGIPVAYFFDDQTTEQVTAQIGLAAAMRDAGVASAATRMIGLSPGSVDAVRALTEQLRRLEGLE